MSIQEVARLTGTTSRTLRHYDAKGLVRPSRLDAHGMRYYDQAALTRLQRVLLLRQLGLGLPAIAELLHRGISDSEALQAHVTRLCQERDRIDREIRAVEHTISALQDGRPLMAEEMFDGFDPGQYREEVEQRWGEEAYARSDRWWRGLGAPGQKAFLSDSAALAEAWKHAWQAGQPVGGPEVRSLAARHVAWIATGWGGVEPSREQLVGLAEMYAADERFAATYGGVEGASYVRDALVDFAQEFAAPTE